MDLGIEEIPDDDVVSRFLDVPRTYDVEKELLLPDAFVFCGGIECVVWRRYAPKDSDVHALGCLRERAKREDSKKLDYRYVGFKSAGVEEVRRLRTTAGHGYDVIHAPDEGKHHAVIQHKAAEGQIITKAHKSDLRELIHQAFASPRVSHRCPDVCAEQA